MAASAASCACASQSCAMNGLAASSPAATTSSVGAWRPPRTSSQVCSVDSASTIMIATSALSPDPTLRPATTMSNTESVDWLWVGKATQSPSTRPIRTPPIGPENGRPEIWVDSDAALMASTS